MLTVGVDVGGTFVKFGLVRGGRILRQGTARTTRYGPGPAGVSRVIVEAVRSLREDGGPRPRAVGVGIPGVVEYPEGIVRTCANLPGWDRVRLKAILERRLRLPVQVDNDAHVMTLAEWRFGAGKGTTHLLCVTLGTGVGGGLVLDGRLYRSLEGPSAEIGHVPINEKGPACSCGGRACLERYVGNRDILRAVRKQLRGGTRSRIMDLVDHRLERLTPEVIDRACELGDPFARRIWEQAGQRIGQALVQAINLLSPERVVIGGGIAKAGRWILDPIRRTVRERAIRALGDVPILPAKLGPSAGLIGAGLLGHEAIHE